MSASTVCCSRIFGFPTRVKLHIFFTPFNSCLLCLFDSRNLSFFFLYASVNRVASLEVTEEFDPQNLLDLLSVFDVNLSSPNKDVRISTLRILSYFVKMDQRLGTNEERPHKRQRTEDSGEETVAKYTNVCLVS